MQKPSNKINHSSRIISGVRWLVLLSWFSRLLGFLSIFILARLLTPEDFGVMALVMIAIQLTDTLTQIGAEQYYIQKKQATKEHLNNAWSPNVVVKAVASLLFFFASPIAASYFGYGHLSSAFMVISCLPLVNALANGVIFKQKKALDYKSFSIISGSSKVISTIVAITLAFIVQSYWALIFGATLQALLFAIFSYVFIKKRASFALDNWQEPFHFSKWMMLKGVVGHIRAKFDVWFAVHIQGIGGLGGYNFSKDLALLPCRELLSPISEVMFTAIAQSENHSKEQHAQINKALAVLFIVACPIAFGWGLIATPFVSVVLGEQWSAYTNTIALLGYLVITFAAGNFISQLMIATGKVKSLFYYDVLTLAVALLMLVWASAEIHSVDSLANFRVIVGIVILAIGMFWLSALGITKLTDFIKTLTFPLLSAAAMAWLTSTIVDTTQTDVTTLILTVTIAAVTYTILTIIGLKLRLFGKNESLFIQSLINQAVSKIIK